MTTALKSLRLLVEGRARVGGKNREGHGRRHPKQLAAWDSCGSPKKAIWARAYTNTKPWRPPHSG